MTELEKKIGYTFKNKEFLETALTHSSYMNEKNTKSCYERLEFLGDSVLGMLTAEMLFKGQPKLSEGELTKRRAMLVCEPSLANAANKLGLGDYLKVGKGEEITGGRARPSILADVVEAILAAIYLDSGIDNARCFAVEHIYTAAQNTVVVDYKTRLQEKVQFQGVKLTYHLINEEGPQHKKLFTVEIRLDDKPMGTGTGSSKKEAEQMAAQRTLEICK